MLQLQIDLSLFSFAARRLRGAPLVSPTLKRFEQLRAEGAHVGLGFCFNLGAQLTNHCHPTRIKKS